MGFWGRHRHVMGKSGNWWENVKIGGAAPIELAAANLLPSALTVALLLWQPLLAMWWPELYLYCMPALLLLGGGATAAALSAAQRGAFDKIEQNQKS